MIVQQSRNSYRVRPRPSKLQSRSYFIFSHLIPTALHRTRKEFGHFEFGSVAEQHNHLNSMIGNIILTLHSEGLVSPLKFDNCWSKDGIQIANPHNLELKALLPSGGHTCQVKSCHAKGKKKGFYPIRETYVIAKLLEKGLICICACMSIELHCMHRTCMSAT